MTAFFWSAGHLGWGFFALLVFSGLWWLAYDLVWRLRDMPGARLATRMGAGWIVGVALILLVSWLAGGW